MKNRSYVIQPAHSGTSEKEIARAKREYLKGVKSGRMINTDRVLIRFSDVNYEVTARFYCAESFYPLG